MRPTLTRRRFVAQASAVPFALRAANLSAQGRSGWALLGSQKGDGIYRARWDGVTGTFSKLELAFATDTPSFLALHPTLPVLYSVNESDEPKAAVSSFHVSHATAELTLIDRRETHGGAPCYVSVDATGQTVFAANYTGGSLTAFRTGPEGGLAQTVGVFRYNQPTHGPVADRQEAAHMHCATISPKNDFVVACDLGDDLILVFPIAPERNSYVGTPVRIAARPGSGPRHVAFHPNGKWVYCIHELDCTIDLYDWNVQAGQLTMTMREGSIVSTMKPFAAVGNNTGCEVLISGDGKFLYACTRGEDTITVYGIDGASGLLSVLQRVPCGGAIPRWIGMDPSHRWMVSANQGSSTVSVLARNRETGKLTHQPGSMALNTPQFVLWL